MSRSNLLDPFFERFVHALSPQRRELARLRAKWGKPAEKDPWLASRYFELTRVDSAARCVDDRTWVDLEFPSIFARLDSSETPLGGQVLFRKLREYVDDPRALAKRYLGYEALRSRAALREQVQSKLATLRADSNAALADFLFGPVPTKPKHYRLLPVWSAISAATLLAVVTLSAPLVLAFAVVAINAVLIYRVSPFLSRDTDNLKSCYQVLGAAEGLASIEQDSAPLPEFAKLRADRAGRARAKKALRLFSASRGELAQSVYIWLNLTFLADYLAYFYTLDRFIRVRSEVASAFESVGSLDAAVAVASFLEQRADHCRPEVRDGALIALEDGYHPLLTNSVKNSIRLDGRSALVAGSNMAGKTTFIKMVAINIVLGRTLGFCLASKATIPRSSVMASIRGEHSVAARKSHYFAEIEAVHSFIETAARGDCKVFVIDELFSGTNTVERLAAARAVLESICRHAQVLVTTHDVELQSELGEDYELHHFREDPDVDGFFDYRLRPGPTTARNAIRLLERMGFPADVVASAMRYAASPTAGDTQSAYAESPNRDGVGPPDSR